MILRPVDSAGDILPVLSSGDLLAGSEAVARLVQYRLSLLKGEWWENPARGFSILADMQFSRLTEADAAALSSQITDYIRQTSGVQTVEDVWFVVVGRTFSYSCMVRTENGTSSVSYSYEF